MKILFITSLLICVFHSAGAQNRLDPSGNVGIGTTNPEAVLQVINVEQDPSAGNTFILGHTNGTNLRMGYNTNYSWIQAHDGKPLYINELGNNLILTPTYSNVGIGVFSPAAKLDVRGGLTKSIYGIIVPTVNIFTKEDPQVGTGAAIALGGKTGLSTADYAFAYLTGAKENNDDYSGYFAVHTVSGGGVNEVSSANYERFRITSNGNVGIGTSTPRERLSVNGNIRAKEVKVETANWPDYVFKPGYKITTLPELEKYIKTNQHLPDFPTALNVENSGVELGDMIKKLLKNQEELTLHLIEQNKKMEILRQQVSVQEQLIKELKTKK